MVSSFTLILFAASLVAGVAAGSAWRRRAVNGGVAFALVLVAIALWCFFSAMETTSASESERYFWAAMSYIGVCNTTPLFLVFACQYSDSRWPLHVGVLALFWSVPVVTLVLAFTNAAHHLIWTGITMGPLAGMNTVVYHHGPWYWVETAWFLGLTVLACYHLLRVAVRLARVYLLQSLMLVAAVVFPWVGLLLFVLPSDPFSGLETTCLGFAFSAVFILIAIRRMHFLDLVPRARATVMEHMQEGFLVVDLRQPDHRRQRGGAPAPRSGSRRDRQGPRRRASAPAGNGGARRREWNTGRDHRGGSGRDAGSLHFSAGEPRGPAHRRIFLVRDISERRRTEHEKERLLVDLQAALANVKRLQGLLPICASCKKIRDDRGYWHQVEQYVQDHAEVEFSHDICPECMARLYPDLAQKDEPRP